MPPAIRLLLIVATLAGCAAPPAPKAPAENPEPSAPVAISPAPSKAPEPPPSDPASNIFFGPASATIDNTGQAVIRNHAQRLKENPRLRVRLVGHSDDLGSRSYNLAIAERRIEAVRARLRTLGVRPHQIHAYIAGNEFVPKSCKTRQCRQQMRRVELLYPEPD